MGEGYSAKTFSDSLDCLKDCMETTSLILSFMWLVFQIFIIARSNGLFWAISAIFYYEVNQHN